MRGLEYHGIERADGPIIIAERREDIGFPSSLGSKIGRENIDLAGLWSYLIRQWPFSSLQRIPAYR